MQVKKEVVAVPSYTIVRGNEKKVVPLSEVIDVKDTWERGGLKIISLVGFKKIAEREGIVVKEIQVLCSPTDGNQQQHWVAGWFGFKEDDNKNNWKVADGEASRLNTGRIEKVPGTDKRKYEEHGEVDAMYRGAMAMKRMFVRGIQEFVVFSEKIYSDVEAQDFKRVTEESSYEGL